MLKIILGTTLLIYTLFYFASFDEMQVYSSMQAVSVLIEDILLLIGSIWLIKSGVRGRKQQKEEGKKKYSIKVFMKEWLSSPTKFNKKHATKKSPPYFFFATWVFGVAHLLNIHRLTIVGNPLMIEVNDWWVLWPTELFMGIFWGIFIYYIIGFIFHGLIKISGGKSNIKTSSNILLYSNIYLYITIILAALLNTIIFGNAYFYGDGVGTVIEISLVIMVIIAAIYSVQQIYKSVISVAYANKKRALIFTFIVPLAIMFFFGWVKFNAAFLYEGDINNTEAIQAFQRGDTEKADRLFDKTIEELSKQGDINNLMKAYINKGILLESNGSTKKAELVYREALEMAPKNSSHYFVLNGLIMSITGDTRQATTQFIKAFDLDQNDFNANNRLGLIYLGRKGIEYTNLAKALKYNKKAYELNPVDVAAIQNLAINYYELESFEDALPLFSILVKNLPNNILSKYLLGMTHYKVGDIKNAKLYLTQAVSLNPNLLTDEIQEILRN